MVITNNSPWSWWWCCGCRCRWPWWWFASLTDQVWWMGAEFSYGAFSWGPTCTCIKNGQRAWITTGSLLSRHTAFPIHNFQYSAAISVAIIFETVLTALLEGRQVCNSATQPNQHRMYYYSTLSSSQPYSRETFAANWIDFLSESPSYSSLRHPKSLELKLYFYTNNTECFSYLMFTWLFKLFKNVTCSETLSCTRVNKLFWINGG